MASEVFMLSRDYGHSHMCLHIGNIYRAGTIDCMETPGQRIRQLRLRKKLNQTQLGELVGKDQSTISDIENGVTKDWSALILMKLCEVLEAPADYIMLGSSAAWPFVNVSLERFLALDPEARAFVEGKLEAAIEAREDAKQRTFATRQLRQQQGETAEPDKTAKGYPDAAIDELRNAGALMLPPATSKRREKSGASSRPKRVQGKGRNRDG